MDVALSIAQSLQEAQFPRWSHHRVPECLEMVGAFVLGKPYKALRDALAARPQTPTLGDLLMAPNSRQGEDGRLQRVVRALQWGKRMPILCPCGAIFPSGWILKQAQGNGELTASILGPNVPTAAAWSRDFLG